MTLVALIANTLYAYYMAKFIMLLVHRLRLAGDPHWVWWFYLFVPAPLILYGVSLWEAYNARP